MSKVKSLILNNYGSQSIDSDEVKNIVNQIMEYENLKEFIIEETGSKDFDFYYHGIMDVKNEIGEQSFNVCFWINKKVILMINTETDEVATYDTEDPRVQELSIYKEIIEAYSESEGCQKYEKIKLINKVEEF